MKTSILGNKTRIFTMNALITAIYVITTMVFSSISFGAIQIRIATCIYQLVVFDKRYYPGCVLGVVIANIISSPLGPVDVLAGIGVTGIGLAIAIGINHFVTKIEIKAFIVGACVSFGMIFVAIELHIISNVPFVATYIYLFVGQAISQFLGYIFFKALNKRINLATLIN